MSSPHGSKLGEWIRLLANRLLTDSQRRRIKSGIHGIQAVPRKLLGVDRLIRSQAGEIERLKSKVVLLEGKLNAGLYGLPSDTEYSAKLISNTLLMHYDPPRSRDWREIAGIPQNGLRFGRSLQAAGVKSFSAQRALVAGAGSAEALRDLAESLPALMELRVADTTPEVLQEIQASLKRPAPEVMLTDPYTALAAPGPGQFDLISCVGHFCRLSGLEQAGFLRMALERLRAGGILYLEVPRLSNPAAADLYWADPRHFRPFSEGWLRHTLGEYRGQTSFVPLDAPHGPESAMTWGVLHRKADA